MQRILLTDFEFNGTKFDKLSVITDQNSNMLLLPTLWSVHLSNIGTSHQVKIKSNGQNTEELIEETDLSDKTITSYISKLFSYLKSLTGPIDNQLANMNTASVNHYLNEVLPKSEISLNTLLLSKSALTSFFNFLHMIGICRKLQFTIYRKTRKKVEDNSKATLKIKYVMRSIRAKLLQSCPNKRDRLILRMGYEVGLRAAENRGLVLNDAKVRNKPQKGLKSLFDELESNPTKLRFEFYLKGKYAKRGKGRWIYFNRPLLEDLKDYFETERNNFGRPKTDHLFVRIDKGNQGKEIGEGHASRIFRNLLNKHMASLKGQYSYHDLRHTFATELYHSELIDENGKDTRSESAAL
jgi:site-specific recombinase XerD